MSMLLLLFVARPLPASEPRAMFPLPFVMPLSAPSPSAVLL